VSGYLMKLSRNQHKWKDENPVAKQDSNSRIRFKRVQPTPIIPRTLGTFYSVHAANPDVLFFKDRYHLYFRGQAEPGHDQIGVAYATAEAFDGIHWEIYPGNPVIPVSGERTDFDSGYILDPAAVVMDNRVYLYYSAHRRTSFSQIGLAVLERDSLAW